MTLSIHWQHARYDAKAATRLRARKATKQVLKAVLTMAGIAAIATAIIAIRVYAFVPGLRW